jgi:serine/threonine protein kinase
MEVLGVGSTSTCHRCVHKRSDHHYACKIIDKQLIEDRFQGMMEQFHTEIDALRSLNHPNIIQLFDVYVTEEKIFIVMELMEGGELFDYVVQKGTLTEEEAARIVHKVTSALVYMHTKNIVHRDLKPENLLLRRKPKNAGDSVEVKIIDFGLSKVCSMCRENNPTGDRKRVTPLLLCLTHPFHVFYFRSA